jgi:hypothetical protein
MGNFGNGRINAFDPVTFEPKGHLKMPNGKAVVIDYLPVTTTSRRAQ